ncbi:exported hypothetical protein [Oceanicaulis sp. 350]|nr:exported hypothetical protein [Oceanicaulis sp. 350]
MKVIASVLALTVLSTATSAQEWGHWYADEGRNPITDVYTATLSIIQEGETPASLEWMCAVTPAEDSGDSRVDFGLVIGEGLPQRPQQNQTPIHYRVDSGEARTVYASQSLNGRYLLVGPDRAAQMFHEMTAANEQIVFTINHLDYYTLPVNSLGEAAARFAPRCPTIAPEPY